MLSRRHLLGILLVPLLGVLWLASAATAQEQPTTSQLYLLTDQEGNEFAGATFAEPFTSGTQMFIHVFGSNGSIGAGLELEGVPIGEWTPTMPPDQPLPVFWSFELGEGPFEGRLVILLSEGGGIGGVGVVLPPGTFERLGEIQRMEAGSGYIHPDYFLEGYDEFLPPFETTDRVPMYTLGFPLSGPEGNTEMLPVVYVEATTTTTTTSTVAETSPPEETAPPETADVGEEPAASEPIAVEQEPTGSPLPLSWLVVLVLLALAVALGFGFRIRRRATPGSGTLATEDPALAVPPTGDEPELPSPPPVDTERSFVAEGDLDDSHSVGDLLEDPLDDDLIDPEDDQTGPEPLPELGEDVPQRPPDEETHRKLLEALERHEEGDPDDF